MSPKSFRDRGWVRKVFYFFVFCSKSSLVEVRALSWVEGPSRGYKGSTS